MASGKIWNRRAAVIGGVGLAAGGYWALRGRSGISRSAIPGKTTLRRGNSAEPETLDNSLASADGDDNIIGDMMVGLMTEDVGARPSPGMAVEWKTSPDGLTWNFKLREAQWSDRVPVTAEDFVFSWRRLVDPATAARYGSYLYLVKNAEPINAGKLPASALGVSAIGERELEVRLEHPAPYLLEMLMHPCTHPLPRHVVSAKGKDWSRPGNHVGNGAFVLKEWIPNGHVSLEKNPRFYDAANVALERIYFYPTDDYSAALQRMRAGELDMQDRIAVQRIDWIRANLPQLLHPQSIFSVEFIYINHRRPPFQDMRVREALNLALNREAIAQRIRRVGDVPAYSLVPPNIANFSHGNSFAFKTMPPLARIERARALMQAAGFSETNRLNTSFLIRSTAPGPYRAVAAAIQQMMAQIHINLSIVPLDFAVFLAQTRSHDFDLAEAGWVADFDDAATFLQELLQTEGGNNDGQYSNPAFDKLLAAAQQDTDLVSRGNKLAQAEALALKDHAILPLFFWVDPNMVWPYVKGWQVNGIDKHRSRWVSIDQAARLKQFP
jgi:oligopeptide transport system substrate-binding protein